MAFVWSLLLGLTIAFMVCPSSSLPLSTSNNLNLPISAISSAPALLPYPPESSPEAPTLSPDIAPLLPSPAGSPTESSLPTIPASPSPPNPDAMVGARPDTAFAPSGSLPVSTSSSVALKLSGYLNIIVILRLVAFWLMQLYGL
ncbi:classical arabinogalactan protein 26-like [Cornus florida]|uniref:classical arabinogalactan protein 26-like n=1 Tax=Cornus florida TaxID=4283 RepID=UPI00289929EC|nr:classical arabinogalactan protein 26-like [Cornus florida]